MAGTSDGAELVIHCTLRVFHEYQKIWLPKFGQKLKIKSDKINLFASCIMALYCEIKGKIESLTLVGLFPREISRFVNIS